MQKLAKFSELQALQRQLHQHPIYNSVKGEANMRTFMQSHVFAVWDFMLLIKRLQRSLTCVERVWTPSSNANTARFINEIVVGEETDVHPNGRTYISHYELYLEAMREVDADCSAVEGFVNSLKKGRDPKVELANPRIPAHVRVFVSSTLDAIERPTPYVASHFLYGREGPIPQMFQRFVNTLEKEKKCDFLKYYLQRHIEVDGQDHGPMGEKLLEELAMREDPTYELVLEGAISAVSSRIKFWDGIQGSLQVARRAEDEL